MAKVTGHCNLQQVLHKQILRASEGCILATNGFKIAKLVNQIAHELVESGDT